MRVRLLGSSVFTSGAAIISDLLCTAVDAEAFESKTRTAIQEFVAAPDFKEFAVTLGELSRPDLHYTVLRIALLLACEGKDATREAITKLLVQMLSASPALLSRADAEKGYALVRCWSLCDAHTHCRCGNVLSYQFE